MSVMASLSANTRLRRGLYARLLDDGTTSPAMLIGELVPEVYEPEGAVALIYTVIEHPDGTEIVQKDGTRRRLLAYPRAWPGPGQRSGRYIYASHPSLEWNAPVPCFDETAEVIVLEERRALLAAAS